MRLLAGQYAARLIIFGAVWWILVEGDLRSPLLAMTLIILAAAASVAMVPGGRMPGLIGLARLVGFFLAQSVYGGVDVLRRALHPRMPLRPGFIDLQLRVEAEPARALVASITSLLPGSLSVEVGVDRIRVHVLDTSMAVPDVVLQLEEHVARVFGEPIARDPS